MKPRTSTPEPRNPAPQPPVYVGADLSAVPLDEALQGTGFDPSAPTLFTLEGLLYYLPPAAVQGLFGRISSMCAPGEHRAAGGLQRKGSGQTGRGCLARRFAYTPTCSQHAGSRIVFDLLDHEVFSGSKIQMGYHAFRLVRKQSSG